jgi:hypothetical protein
MVVNIKQDARLLHDIEGEKRFFCHDGYVIKNLDELAQYLNRMTEDVFQYHVNSEKNDFSNWIRDVIGDTRLADELRKADNPLESSKILIDKMYQIQKNRAKSVSSGTKRILK